MSLRGPRPKQIIDRHDAARYHLEKAGGLRRYVVEETRRELQWRALEGGRRRPLGERLWRWIGGRTK